MDLETVYAIFHPQSSDALRIQKEWYDAGVDNAIGILTRQFIAIRHDDLPEEITRLLQWQGLPVLLSVLPKGKCRLNVDSP